MNHASNFLFACCQFGAENALKMDVVRRQPELKVAFSRPGFVTLRRDGPLPLPIGKQIQSVFCRANGTSNGNVKGEHAEEMADRFWQTAPSDAARHLHVWARETCLPGDQGYEPGRSLIATEVGEILMKRRAQTHPAQKPLRLNQPARPGHRVVDCVLIEPGHWWVGHHVADGFSSRYPGGVVNISRPATMISRAYLKVVEAMLWSRFPILPGDRCVEIGSSPGGACQALLDRGMIVTGIDPAEMATSIAEHPNFHHVRKRGRDLKRREYRDFRWLMADSNVAPNHTLDTVEDIVTHSSVHIRGLLLTLKLIDWELVEQIPSYLERVRGWGYQHIKVRQLAFNRQEICLAALRRKSMLKGRSKESRKRARKPV